MKILPVIALLFFLLATPALADAARSFGGGPLIASSQEGNGSMENPSGRIVIKGKGGKVTDVEQAPDDHRKKKKKKKKDD